MAQSKWIMSAAILAAALTFGIPARAQAPSAAGAPAAGSMQSKRAQVEAELEANPSLVDDPKYLAAHPRLARMLDRHPEAKEKIRKDPKGFFEAMNRRRRLFGGM
jgi:hypothetical protein